MITTDLNLVCKSLNDGKIVAIPTETVYGLAGNALKKSSIEKIYALKKRPPYNPLIVHISSFKFLPEIAREIPNKAKKLASKFWPGPLTLVLKKNDTISNQITSGKDTVAVRVPSHPLSLKLLEKIEFPLVAPSANPFGSISPTSAIHVKKYFDHEIDLILDGGVCSYGLESTIVGFDDNKPILYRHGAITIETIEKEIGKITHRTENNKTPNAPGMHSRHYAPKTPIILSKNINKTIGNHPKRNLAVLLFKKFQNIDKTVHHEILSIDGNLEEAARNLYSIMHKLDQMNFDLIIAPYFPDSGLGKTINDRLNRAVKK